MDERRPQKGYKVYEIILADNKGSSRIYQYLLKTIKYEKPTGISRWEKILNQVTDWKMYFNYLCNLTNNIKLRWFQFRILHNILTTNRSISKYDPTQSDMCSFCNIQSESILHLLWECNISQSFF